MLNSIFKHGFRQYFLYFQKEHAGFRGRAWIRRAGDADPGSLSKEEKRNAYTLNLSLFATGCLTPGLCQPYVSPTNQLFELKSEQKFCYTVKIRALLFWHARTKAYKLTWFRQQWPGICGRRQEAIYDKILLTICVSAMRAGIRVLYGQMPAVRLF